MLHDEDRYPEPDVFTPARFLTDSGELDQSVPYPDEAFGFSRRICPGRYFAEDVLFLAMANTLAVFTIEKPLDERGSHIEPKEKFTGGLLRFVTILCADDRNLIYLNVCSHPLPFHAKFTPRSSAVRELVKNSSLLM